MERACGPILLVDADPAMLSALAHTLGAWPTLGAGSAEQALAILARTPVAVVVASQRLPGASGVELLRRCAQLQPSCRRLLCAEHAELAEIWRAAAPGLCAHVLPRAGRPEHLVRRVRELLGEPPAGALLPVGEATHDCAGTEELLRQAVRALAQVPGVILRRLYQNLLGPQLQLVAPRGPELERLRETLVRGWLWPLKPRGARPARADRAHPVLQRLAPLRRDDEVYARPASDADAHAYVAILPWRDRTRVTVALGVWTPSDGARARATLRELHAFTFAELPELQLPPPPTLRAGRPVAVPEYDWLATATYAGPDRRERDTSLFNRYLLRGRRRSAPRALRACSDAFVDRLTPRARRLGLAFSLLSAADAWLTLRHCRRTLRELNPLLRPLLHLRPPAFLALKTALALTAFLVVARFQLSRKGAWALPAVVLLYALLDAYWTGLLRHSR